MTPYNSRILIVDDEVDFAKGIARQITAAFPECRVELAHNGTDGLAALEAFAPHVMLLDLRLPGMDGHEVLHQVKARYPDVSVVILTGHGTVATAVSALRSGAWDFLTKPVRGEDLIRSLSKAFERSHLLGENQRLTQLMSRSGLHHTLIGESASMLRLKESLRAVAAASYTVLVRGESGTGKELVAESVHTFSDRANKPLVRVNCPAIPEHLLESELFGHVKGAFTGAVNTRKGMFLEASGGVLFLDEIGDISLGVQTKLLRVLQDGEVRPVGASQSFHTDTRVIAVTNQNLEAKIKAGTFREDLYYRLNVVHITLPPLRERREDIPMLISHFIDKIAAENGAPKKNVAPEALDYFSGYEWPGNIRQLENVVERCMVMVTGDTITVADLPPEVKDEESQLKNAIDLLPPELNLAETLDTLEAAIIRRALVRSDFVQVKAAEQLAISKSLLQYKLRKYGITGH